MTETRQKWNASGEEVYDSHIEAVLGLAFIASMHFTGHAPPVTEQAVCVCEDSHELTR